MEEKPRTFHDLECSRLHGEKWCDCGRATPVDVPAHFTPIDPIRYSYNTRPTIIEREDITTVRIDGVTVDVFRSWSDGGEAAVDAAVRHYPTAKVHRIGGTSEDS